MLLVSAPVGDPTSFAVFQAQLVNLQYFITLSVKSTQNGPAVLLAPHFYWGFKVNSSNVPLGREGSPYRHRQ
ncbi:hypothetical protein Y032_0682g1493 [Ancylostoma ceylanicum]|uniref:Uncharacterized protein n=1 Tax=Ancylostoma ceylanicum TaxID=53326 RepID=A0A016WJ13_9BILA|nr:hypothetical protein Y032_0682g1493 [Ancylostoma ceylanicum]